MTDDEKRELIAEAEECSAFEREELGDDAYIAGLLSRLADALEGTLDESEWEYGLEYSLNDGSKRRVYPHPSRESAESKLQLEPYPNGRLVRQLIGPWEVVTDDRD